MDLRPEEPPGVVAARRTHGTQPRSGTDRAYPPLTVGEDHEALSALLAATRALLHTTTPAGVVHVLATLVHDLGGGVVPARLAAECTTVQIDVSLGLSEPLLPWADPVSLGAMRLTTVLPGFVEDARLVLERLQGAAQRDDEATRDVLTGLLTRRAWMRRLSLAKPGDSVCLIDLDHFKTVNDTEGHAAGDEVLRALGGLLSRSFRDGDFCGRYGGDELVCLTLRLGSAGLGRRCDRLRREWVQQRPAAARSVGLSIGVAPVMESGGRAALRLADEAMYRAKTGGRNRTEIGGPPTAETGLT